MARRDTISSNATSLLIARETVPGVIPTDALWYMKEPNEYDDFGAEINTVARSPINSDRQRKKGTPVGFDANGGYTTDLTATNLVEEAGGFLFAAPRTKSSVVGTEVLADGITVANGLPYVEGTLVHVSESAVPSNNGLKVATADGTPTKVTIAAGLTADAGDVVVTRAGFEFNSGDASIVIIGGLPALRTVAFDLTTLGILPGEIVYLGGDDSSHTFATVGNRGYCRVLSVAANTMIFDKTDAVFVADAGTGKFIRLFFGTVVKNEASALQTATTYSMRRQLGNPIGTGVGSDVTQSEVLVKCLCNEMTINIPEEDKITVDLSYMAGDYKVFEDDSVIGGTIVEVAEEDAINSTGDAVRASMVVYDGTSAPTPVIAYFQEFSISINNNVSANKAVTKMGAFALTPGNFEVDGSFTGYFVGVDALQAVRDNADASFLFCTWKDNKGVAIDLPMLSLSTSGLSVEQNEPITIELDGQAATGRKYNAALDHTMLMVFFPYLPDAAKV